MDRSIFLKSVRAQGYKGKAVLADIKAWMDEQGLDSAEIETAGGVKHKIDEVWAVTAPLALTEPEVDDDHDAGDESETKGADDSDNKGADADKVKEAKARGRKQHKPDGRGLVALGKVAVHTSGHNMALKRYESKIKMTQQGALSYTGGHKSQRAAVYDSPEMAEVAGAFWRKASMQSRRWSYEQEDNDDSILENYGINAKAMSGNVNSAGGVFVPVEFLPDVIWLTEGYGLARKLARREPMARDTKEVPRKTSIPTFVASAQNAAMTASDMGTDMVKLVAQKFYAYSLVSNELLNDSAVNIADEYGRSYAEGCMVIEDKCYFLGDGTSTYAGINGLSTALPSAAYFDTTGSTWAATTEADIRDGILGQLENVQGGNIAIVCSRQYFVQVFQRLSSAAGGRLEAEFNTNKVFGEAFGGADAVYKGIPVYFSQVMPTVTATTGRMMYAGAFNTASIFADRQELRIASSDQVGFASDQMAFRATTRFDVNICGDGRSTTYGPIMAAITG